jgi:long-subunit fatty acid transport protein
VRRLNKKTVKHAKTGEIDMKLGIVAALLAGSAFGPAWAGGFERSGLPLGFMFEAGNYAELSFGYAAPTVEGSAAAGLAPTGDIAKDYSSLGIAFKTDLNDKLSLGFTIDPSYGADVAYPNPSPGPGPYPIRGTNATLNGDTVALIGRYKLNENFSVHAGLRSVGIGGNASIASDTVAPNGVPFYSATYAHDRSLGYLVGAAYEKPEIALRVALTYASETKHDMATSVFGNPVGIEEIELPKSLTLDAQSGIAANTLLFGSVRWVDWTSTRMNSIGYPAPPLISHAHDSITYTMGIGRKFSDAWSGAVSFGYEASKGGVATNLAPTDGFWSVGIGGTYTSGNMKISGGVRYVDIGDANSLQTQNAPGGAATFQGNSAIGVGIKVGFTF